MDYKKIISAVALFTLASCVRMPVPREAQVPVKQSSATVPVYVIADTLHTQLAVPYEWLRDSGYKFPNNFKKPNSWNGKHNYVVMSWGDRIAFVNKRWMYPWEVFYALFMPSPSVTEIVPVSWKIETVCFSQRIYEKRVPYSAGKNLAAFLNANNLLDQNGAPKIRKESTWGDGYLLDCKHSYYFPRICNVWTAQCLEACGEPITITSALSANGLIEQCEKNGFSKTHNGIHE